MKNILIIIVFVIPCITAIAQNYSAAEYDRIEFAKLMNENLQAEGFQIQVNAYGPNYLMLSFSGEGVNNVIDLAAFLTSAGWATFESFYNDYGFIFMCFPDLDICYKKEPLRELIYTLNSR